MNRIRLITAIPMALALVVLAAWGCGGDPSPELPLQENSSRDNRQNAPGERCVRHDLPDTDCFICDPVLRESGRLWCGEHDRYEDRCFICHPEVEDPDRLWCREHNLYEDECTLCHPELRDAPRPGASVSSELACPEHGVLENECGICHPELAADLDPGSGLLIRFESAQSAAKAGVETARPVVANDHSEVTFLARVAWDQNHFARVTPLAGGVLRYVAADVGQSVSRGDRMATLTSPEVSRAKSEYFSARAEEELKLTVLAREKELVAQNISARQDLDQARAAYEVGKNLTAMMRQRLLNFGLTERAILLLEETGSTSSELDILAPLSGTVVDRHAVPGEAVEPGDALFKIARLSSMWLELSIPENEVSTVSIGQSVGATFDAQPGLQATGRVTWIGSSVDEQSRMVKGRAEVANPDLLLRHGMFGRASIRTEFASDGLFVPAGAVQHIDDRAFVFVRLADDLFELRRVSLGFNDGATIAIMTGLEPQDEIVVAHSFTLKSEFLKSRLGAGCVDE